MVVRNQVAAAADSITPVKTMRPPIWSVQMPNARRISEPVRMGVAASRPNWVSLSPSSCLICRPMMEKIVHTAKHTVNESVLAHNATCCCTGLTWRYSDMAEPLLTDSWSGALRTAPLYRAC